LRHFVNIDRQSIARVQLRTFTPSLLARNLHRLSDIGSGWLPIVAALLEKMTIIDPNVEILQIKQKLGGLRIYYHSTQHDELQTCRRR
jgi:hypothetical protein